jgi:hypothetical protein
MPFVKRDATGALAALFRERAADATEYLAPDHPAVRAFAAAAPAEPTARARLLDSDLDMIRVYEDLIDVLGKRLRRSPTSRRRRRALVRHCGCATAARDRRRHPGRGRRIF